MTKRDPAAKHFLASKTIWGALVMAAVGVLAVFDVEVTDAETQLIAESIAGLAGALLVVFGRLTAKQKLTM